MVKLLSLFASTALAADPPAGLKINTANITLQQLAANILSYWVVPVLMALAVGAAIYGGVLYITSSGDPQKIQTAHKVLLYAFLGILLIAFCYLIVISLNGIVKGFF